jgi:hypothetical protein
MAKTSAKRPKPKVNDGSGSSKRLRGVGLIHSFRNPRSSGWKRRAHDKTHQVHGNNKSQAYTSLTSKTNGQDWEERDEPSEPVWSGRTERFKMLIKEEWHRFTSFLSFNSLSNSLLLSLDPLLFSPVSERNWPEKMKIGRNLHDSAGIFIPTTVTSRFRRD